MKQQITKLNESALLSIFDPVTAKALVNAVRIAGNDTNGTTVPEVAEQANETDAIVSVIKEQVLLLQDLVLLLQSSPTGTQQDDPFAQSLGLTPVITIPEQVEFLQTQVRQIAEQLAQVTDHFTTEVRQLADQQIVNANLIQELKQGTML